MGVKRRPKQYLVPLTASEIEILSGFCVAAEHEADWSVGRYGTQKGVESAGRRADQYDRLYQKLQDAKTRAE